MPTSFLIEFVILFGMLASIGYAQDSSVDSPQLAFESYNNAIEKKDWDSLFLLISPAHQDYLIFEAVFAMGMNSPNKEADAIIDKYVDKAKLEDLFAGYKQPPTTEETHTILSQSIQDKKGMFLDCLKYRDQQEKKDPTKKPKMGPLVNLVVKENAASAISSVTHTIVSYSRNDGDDKDVRHEQEITSNTPIYFIKSDRKWLIATQPEWQKHNALNTGK